MYHSQKWIRNIKKEMDIQSDNRDLRSSEQQCVLTDEPIESS